MTLKFKRFYIALTLVCLLTPLYSHSVLSTSISTWFCDALLKLKYNLQFRGQPVEGSGEIPVVIVHIDEESYQKLDLKWPWRRDLYIQILKKLKPLNPSAIALDFVFAKKSQDPSIDVELTKILRQFKEPVLASFFQSGSQLMNPFDALLNGTKPRTGIINAIPDQDGIVRRQVLFAADHQKKVLLPSFSLQTASSFSGKENVRKWLEKIPFWSFDDYAILDKTDASAFENLNFDSFFQVGTNYTIKPHEIPVVPAWKILSETANLNFEIFENKIIFVGSQIQLLKDTHHTPFGQLSGAQIHALNTMMVLRNARPYLETNIVFSYLAIFLMLLAAHYFFMFHGRWVALVLSIVFVAICIALSAVLFVQFHLFWEPGVPIVGILTFILVSFLFEKSSQMFEVMRLKNMVIRDELTGAYNYRYLETCVNEILKKIEADERYTLIALDLDLFKEINDTFGHEQGNEVLRLFANALSNEARKGDLVFRYGGDEFMVLLKDSQKNSPATYLERVKESLEALFVKDSTVCRFRFSAGAVAIRKGKFNRFKEVVESADSYLYKAKEQGRNTYFIEREGTRTSSEEKTEDTEN